jgi:hypothetical protein
MAKWILSSIVIIVVLLGVGSVALAHPLNVQTKDSISFHLFIGEDNTVGYDIFVNQKLFIHQPSIPGIPGKSGFISKADAETVAKLVVKKIQSGIMPPTVDVTELDSLQIKHRK